MKGFAESQEIKFDFVIIKAVQFNSGFTKEAFEQIQIEFDTLKRPYYFGKVTNTLKANKSVREKFFICFIERTNTDKKINVRNLAIALGEIAIKELADNN